MIRDRLTGQPIWTAQDEVRLNTEISESRVRITKCIADIDAYLSRSSPEVTWQFLFMVRHPEQHAGAVLNAHNQLINRSHEEGGALYISLQKEQAALYDLQRQLDEAERFGPPKPPKETPYSKFVNICKQSKSWAQIVENTSTELAGALASSHEQLSSDNYRAFKGLLPEDMLSNLDRIGRALLEARLELLQKKAKR